MKTVHRNGGKTTHYSQERTDRDALIRANGGFGKPLACVLWDRGHVDGPEYHVMAEDAIIVVYNAWTQERITAKFARPGQIRQLTGKPNASDRNNPFYHWNLPQSVMQRAAWYESQGLNNA